MIAWSAPSENRVISSFELGITTCSTYTPRHTLIFAPGVAAVNGGSECVVEPALGQSVPSSTISMLSPPEEAEACGPTVAERSTADTQRAQVDLTERKRHSQEETT